MRGITESKHFYEMRYDIFSFQFILNKLNLVRTEEMLGESESDSRYKL